MQRPTVAPDERLAYSVSYAAELLGISKAMLYELLSAGAIRSRKVGARRLIPRDALIEFLAAEA